MLSQETQQCVIKQHTQQNQLPSVQHAAGINKHKKKRQLKDNQ